jgi:hypothetical protein
MRPILAALIGVAFACASSDRLSLTPRVSLTSDDYDDILEDWTRKDEIYDALDSVLFVFVTFHSPEFRKAFILRHPDVYGPGSDEASRIALTNPTAELYHEFFISASTNDVTWNDLDKNEKSIWRVTLIGDGDEVVEGTVEKVKTTANIREIYPHITDFAKTYRVRFPLTGVSGKPIITSHTSHFTLRIASALGAAEMSWDLRPE